MLTQNKIIKSNKKKKDNVFEFNGNKHSHSMWESEESSPAERKFKVGMDKYN